MVSFLSTDLIFFCFSPQPQLVQNLSTSKDQERPDSVTVIALVCSRNHALHLSWPTTFESSATPSLFWSNNSATTFAIANTDLLVIFLVPAINIPKGSAHLVNPFVFKVALSFVDTVCAFLHAITFTFALSVEVACTQLWQTNMTMGRRSVKFMMTIPV